MPSSLSIRTVKGKCKRCYVCIRSCPSKAIKVKNGQAFVLPKRCVSCGFCTVVCNQGGKKVRKSKKKVAALLTERAKVVAVLDPSFVVSFPEVTPEGLVGSLKKLGFKEVWDGSFGAELVAREYKRLLERESDGLIASHCHTVVNLVEKHYPELIPKLAPVVSPMIALGRFIKENQDAGVIYIGPCIAKKDETRDDAVKGAIDEALIFEELKEMLDEAKIQPPNEGEGFDGYISPLGSLSVMAGGLSRNIGVAGDIFKSDVFITGGKDRCLEVLEGFRENQQSFRLLDVMFCQAGCLVDGPATDSSLNLFKKRTILTDYARQETDKDFGPEEISEHLPDLTRTFKDRSTNLKVPTAEDIREILRKTNRLKREDELNCGACGYPSCLEKAKACIQGLAEIEMCLPYLLEKTASSKEEEIKAIIESMNEGLVVFDREMHITLFNQTASEITCFPKNQAIGKPCWEIFHSDKCHTPDCPYQMALEGEEEPSNYESTILSMDGVKIPIRSSIALLYNEEGEINGAVKSFTNISRQKEIDQMKSEFISQVSHELRTPLASIKGSTDLLLAGTEGELNPDQRNFLGIVKNNADRLIRLIGDILDLSKIEAGRLQLQMRLINIDDLVKEVISNIRVLAEDKDLEMEVSIPERLPRIPIDPDRIRQVLINLISNAIKYTPTGNVRVGVADRGETLEISVKDTGIGIDPKDFDRIFEKFQPVDPSQPKGVSVGLGLSICKGIVEAHGGEIWIESEPDKGSIFTFALPKEKRRTEEELPRKVSGVTGKSFKKILVVDDDLDMLKVFSSCLEKEGYEVAMACDGREAVKKAREIKPDLITLDILMPEMDGFEVLERLKDHEETKEIPVIIASIVRDPDKKLFRFGIADYLRKPFDPELLIEHVKKIEGQTDQARTKKILIVEDEPDLVRIISNILTQEGYHPMGAYGGEEALILARHDKPDLILLDLMIPRVDGFEVIRQLKKDKATSSIPIIVLTIRDIESDRVKALGLGATAYMTKPFSQDILAKEIRKRLSETIRG